jgi:hypothetical protein
LTESNVNSNSSTSDDDEEPPQNSDASSAEEQKEQTWGVVAVLKRRTIRNQIQYFFKWDNGEADWDTEDLYCQDVPGKFRVVFGGDFLTKAEVTSQLRALDAKSTKNKRK